MPDSPFEPFPILSTDRLDLRQLELTDQEEIFQLRSDVKIARFLSRPSAKVQNEAIQFIEKINRGILKGQWIYWALVPKGKAKLIGTICLWNFHWAHQRAEVGYELSPESQGKGMMQEALSAVLAFGFDKLTLNHIEARLHPQNQRSIKLLERNGFKKGEPTQIPDLLVYNLFRSEQQ